MAATEVEALAALVGIEIVPNNVDKEESAQQTCEETLASVDDVHGGVVIGREGTETGNIDPQPMALNMGKLSALEQEFANRYTDSDKEFAHTLSTPTHPPPCVSPWWSNDRGHDRSRGRGRGGHSWGRGGHDNRRHDDYRNDHHRSFQGRGYQGHHRDDRRDNYRKREPHHEYRDRSPVNRHQY